jgi:hypothetical protein
MICFRTNILVLFLLLLLFLVFSVADVATNENIAVEELLPSSVVHRVSIRSNAVGLLVATSTPTETPTHVPTHSNSPTLIPTPTPTSPKPTRAPTNRKSIYGDFSPDNVMDYSNQQTVVIVLIITLFVFMALEVAPAEVLMLIALMIVIFCEILSLAEGLAGECLHSTLTD